MRIVGGVLLLLVATAIGLLCPLLFGMTGLDWAGPKPSILEHLSQWAAERDLFAGVGFAALTTWLALTVADFFVLFFGRTRRHPLLASILVATSAVFVIGATVAVLAAS
jgi:hypothetical protein